MTIAEVSKKYGLTTETLRYYEKEGLLPHIIRKESGIRNYDENACKWVEFIKCMRSAGLPVEVLARYVKLFDEGDGTVEERKKLLIEQRDALVKRIADMNVTLERLNYKIDNYDSIMADAAK